jgi:hypothetical protein
MLTSNLFLTINLLPLPKNLLSNRAMSTMTRSQSLLRARMKQKKLLQEVLLAMLQQQLLE